MSKRHTANVAVKANIWCNPKVEECDDPPPPYFLESIIPGDLRVHFIQERDVRVLPQRLTHQQYHEYLQSRFFQREGQEGYAFED